MKANQITDLKKLDMQMDVWAATTPNGLNMLCRVNGVTKGTKFRPMLSSERAQELTEAAFKQVESMLSVCRSEDEVDFFAGVFNAVFSKVMQDKGKHEIRGIEVTADFREPGEDEEDG